MAAISDHAIPLTYPEEYPGERELPVHLRSTLHPKALAMYRSCRERLHCLCMAMADTADTFSLFNTCMMQLIQETNEYNDRLSSLARGGAGDKPAAVEPSRFAEKFSATVASGYAEYCGTFSTDEKIRAFVQKKIDAFTPSYLRATGDGAVDAFASLACALRHPVDEIVKPAAVFLVDAAKVALFPDEPGEARGRMRERGRALDGLIGAIKYGSGPERVRIATAIGVSIFGLQLGAAGIGKLRIARQLPVSEGKPIAACKAAHDARHLAVASDRSHPYISSWPATIEKARARIAAHQKAIFSEAHELKAFVPQMRVLPVTNTTEFYRACDSLYVSSSKLGPTGRGFAKMNLPFLERGDNLVALVHKGRTPLQLRGKGILTPLEGSTGKLGKSAGISSTEWVKEAVQALTKKAGPKSLYVMWDPEATALASTVREMGGSLLSRGTITSELGRKTLAIAEISLRIS